MCQGICDLAKSKKCKIKKCPCYRGHTLKSTCEGGCDDHPEQVCISTEKKLKKCKTESCNTKIGGSINSEYCDNCKRLRNIERAKKYNREKRATSIYSRLYYGKKKVKTVRQTKSPTKKQSKNIRKLIARN